jgi:Ca2+/Na+ antiporter
METIRRLLVWLYAAFLILAITGVFLIFQSSRNPSRQDAQSEKTEMKMEFTPERLQIDLATVMPGVIVFLIGGAGLLLMLIKVPVKEIVGYEQPAREERSAPAEERHLDSFPGSPLPVLSETAIGLPVLLWWIVKSKGTFARISRQ